MADCDPNGCLHCAIAKLREEQFPALPIDKSIWAMLELIADYVSGESPSEQQRLIAFAARVMQHNHDEIRAGVYKVDIRPTSASKHH